MTNPIDLIVIDADGEIITAANGKISSDNPELVKIVKEAAKYPRRIRLVAPYGQMVKPSLDPKDLIGITAAMYSARPGRTRLLEAPVEVKEWFRKERANQHGCAHTTNITKDFQFQEIDEIVRAKVERMDRKDGGDKK